VCRRSVAPKKRTPNERICDALTKQKKRADFHLTNHGLHSGMSF
jgi:hypothetical protein